ncbi:MBL fold metallo-hydrolase [Haloarchaeobius amylolyticus]|uniref:MBL fold metallo-hydrolase n=1 Tax=Haloarchaeobius amylolyticus TaxID=1198296 RepID=UPI00226ED59E|nr:MBL fold metallo-hydrolase [Haloarchaeobius amylolyticus]
MATTERTVEIAEGVYRCGSQRLNWYLIEENDELTVVDTGFPTHWEGLIGQLDTLGYDLADIEACLLTHAHPDHIGFAAQLRERADLPVWLHPGDRERAQAGGQPPLGGFVKNLWRPAVLRYLIEVLQSDGTSIPPVRMTEPLEEGSDPDVPGQPQVIHLPGHTDGEVAFYLPDREVLLCGDALATVDFETWRGNSPQLLPPWLNVDDDRARESLARLESLGEVVLLPGHGDPWTGDLADAIRGE